MSENQKFVAAGAGMVGATILLMVALSFYHPGPAYLDNDNGTNMTLVKNAPSAAAVTPVPTATAAVLDTATTIPMADRIYRDSHGTLMSESETEAKLQDLRQRYNAISDDSVRAYSQGMLKALEKEWARIKSLGPVPSGEQSQPVSSKEISAELNQDRRHSRQPIGDRMLGDAQKRKIFYALVAAQDSGIGDVESYLLIGKTYNIPHQTLLEIVHEGVAKDWPKP
ncbi:hypothetical protein ETAA8_30510 [Anatilimnocola aggregata]|uniref:Uncharacterized protein n=1 Tax=Anatilimnocola aggregata TaxID=2528021 RepID=A0A517YCN9_9BACT|nr:hypothetical protein [Anatilimnocola aggregata]QDU27959.1 hypothetical protein ETAA8_30510 [Anatilimnocola aggregata]